MEQLRDEQRRILVAAEAQGRAAGLAAAQKEIDARLKALDENGRALQAALTALARPLAQVDDLVHEQIAMLALEIARGLLRRELRADPTQVIGMVRETVAMLPRVRAACAWRCIGGRGIGARTAGDLRSRAGLVHRR